MRLLAKALTALALFLTCLDGGAVQAQGTTAAPAEAASAKRKINLAGRQRMITQFMAKATCFVGLGVDEKSQINEAYAMHDLFEQTLMDLHKGNPALGLLPETDGEVLAALKVVSQDWQLYSRAVMQGDLKIIIALNLMVLESSNDAVETIQRRYSALGSVRPDLAAALNISGRQRMLSQKASKEHCLIASGENVAANREALLGSIALFERSLKGLRDGDPGMGLSPNTNEKILDLLKTGEEQWTPLKSILEQAAKGGKPSIEEVAAVARLNVTVLKAMNEIVEAFEAMGS